MLGSDVNRWMQKDGITFLKELGIRNGEVVLDYGCGSGHYALPAAKVIGTSGTVIGIDQDKSALSEMMRLAISEGLENVVPILTQPGSVVIPLRMASVNTVLLYDVLHYFSPEDRIDFFHQARRVLVENGLFSLFPKHHKSDWAMWHLAEMDLDDIIREVEGCGFDLTTKSLVRLLHDEYLENNYILNFRKK